MTYRILRGLKGDIREEAREGEDRRGYSPKKKNANGVTSKLTWWPSAALEEVENDG